SDSPLAGPSWTDPFDVAGQRPRAAAPGRAAHKITRENHRRPGLVTRYGALGGADHVRFPAWPRSRTNESTIASAPERGTGPLHAGADQLHDERGEVLVARGRQGDQDRGILRTGARTQRVHQGVG